MISFASLLIKIKNLKIRGGEKTSLVPYADTIWKMSILFVIVILAVVIIYDAYVYLQIRELQESFINFTDPESDLKNINRPLFDRAAEITNDRLNTFFEASINLPSSSPFR